MLQRMMDLSKELWHWVIANARWLGEAWPVWGAIAAIVTVAGITMQLPGKLEDRIRYCGVTLELFGILTVVHGIKDKQRLLKETSYFEIFRNWLKRRYRWGAKPKVISAELFANASATASMNATIWRGPGPDPSLEARVVALEANLKTLREIHAETENQLAAEKRQRVETIDKERQLRESAIRQLQTQLVELGVGNIHVEAVGVFWLLVGMVLSTISAEIALWINLII